MNPNLLTITNWPVHSAGAESSGWSRPCYDALTAGPRFDTGWAANGRHIAAGTVVPAICPLLLLRQHGGFEYDELFESTALGEEHKKTTKVFEKKLTLRRFARVFSQSLAHQSGKKSNRRREDAEVREGKTHSLQ